MTEASTVHASREASALPAPVSKTQQRRRLLAGFALIIIACALIFATYWYFILSKYVYTDDAYVNAEVAQVTPLVGGPVKSIEVVNTQAVKKGQVLVRLDDDDARFAVEQARADFDRARRRVEGYLATDQALTAQVAARSADLERAAADLKAAQATFDRAKIDYDRRRALLQSGAVSAEEVTSAEQVFATANANLASAKAGIKMAEATKQSIFGNLRVNRALIEGTTVDSNPEVVAARAKLQQMELDLERDVIRAPSDGIVAQRQVQNGQHVDPGVVLMTIVPVTQTYVDANYKEGQLTHVQPGQKAELTSDLYGSSVVFHGVVTGLAGGTGAAFAIIPAQNATGNWIKVVQRIPVRITLDPQELTAHPLRVGMSMYATIDTTSQPAS